MRVTFLFLAFMLLLPLVVGIAGFPIVLGNPDLKPAVAKVFFASLIASGVGQSLFFGKIRTAIIILLCGAVVFLSIR